MQFDIKLNGDKNNKCAKALNEKFTVSRRNDIFTIISKFNDLSSTVLEIEKICNKNNCKADISTTTLIWPDESEDSVDSSTDEFEEKLEEAKLKISELEKKLEESEKPSDFKEKLEEKLEESNAKISELEKKLEKSQKPLEAKEKLEEAELKISELEKKLKKTEDLSSSNAIFSIELTDELEKAKKKITELLKSSEKTVNSNKDLKLKLKNAEENYEELKAKNLPEGVLDLKKDEEIIKLKEQFEGYKNQNTILFKDLTNQVLELEHNQKTPGTLELPIFEFINRKKETVKITNLEELNKFLNAATAGSIKNL